MDSFAIKLSKYLTYFRRSKVLREYRFENNGVIFLVTVFNFSGHVNWTIKSDRMGGAGKFQRIEDVERAINIAMI